MKSKKVLKIVLILIALIIVIFLVITLRKVLIIKSLQKNIEKYTSSTNYHIQLTENMKDLEEDNEVITIVDLYKKDNKKADKLVRQQDGKESKMLAYQNSERTDIFIEDSEGNKIAKINEGSDLFMKIDDFLVTENTWQTIIYSMRSKIKSVDYNGKQCYCIEGFMDTQGVSGAIHTLYIEKETGLCLKAVTDISTSDREYEFDNVSNEVFVEPDIGEYTIK